MFPKLIFSVRSSGSYIGGIGTYNNWADSYNKLVQPASQRRKRRVLFSQAQVIVRVDFFLFF